MPNGWRTIKSIRLHGRRGKETAESFSREKLRHAPQKEGGWEILRNLPPVWPRLVHPTNLTSRIKEKKTYTHTLHYCRLVCFVWWPGMAISSVSAQYNGGCLPDIILLTQGYYHQGTHLNAVKRFCLCSIWNNRFIHVLESPYGLIHVVKRKCDSLHQLQWCCNVSSFCSTSRLEYKERSMTLLILIL